MTFSKQKFEDTF